MHNNFKLSLSYFVFPVTEVIVTTIIIFYSYYLLHHQKFFNFLIIYFGNCLLELFYVTKFSIIVIIILIILMQMQVFTSRFKMMMACNYYSTIPLFIRLFSYIKLYYLMVLNLHFLHPNSRIYWTIHSYYFFVLSLSFVIAAYNQMITIENY